MRPRLAHLDRPESNDAPSNPAARDGVADELSPQPTHRQITVTFDLEDNRREAGQEARFVAMTHRFLEFIEARGVRATVFIVGEIARSHPALVRRVAEGQHEIALHALRHVPLAEVGSRRFPADLRQGRELLEQVSQRVVTGFRAPIFSLTPETAWAVEQLVDVGFTYSSSVLPAANPLNGWRGLPNRPFRWNEGLIEFPCPVGGLGSLKAPFLGGVYVRYMPLSIARMLLRRLPRPAVAWTFLHPYDLDADEAFFVMPHAGWLTSRIVHARRSGTLDRLDALIDGGARAGRPLADITEELASRDLPEVRSSS